MGRLALLLVSAALGAGCAAPAPGLDEPLLLDEVATARGPLTVSRTETPEGDAVFELRLEDAVVHEERDLFSVTIAAAFPSERDARLVLVMLGSGGVGCPTLFRVLEVLESGGARVSPEVGNCGNAFATRWEGGAWRIDVDPAGHAPGESWLYREGRLEPLNEAAKDKARP